jgi:hypothetical protein
MVTIKFDSSASFHHPTITNILTIALTEDDK